MLPSKQQASDIFDRIGALAVNRLELFGLEVREEEQRLLWLIVLGILGLLLSFLAMAMFITMILLLASEEARIWLCFFGGFMAFGLAIGCWFMLLSKIRNSQAPFAVTRQELKKDCGIR